MKQSVHRVNNKHYIPIGSIVCINPDRDTNPKTKKRKLEFAFKDTAKVIRHCANNRTVEVEDVDTGIRRKVERNRLKCLKRSQQPEDEASKDDDGEDEDGGAKDSENGNGGAEVGGDKVGEGEGGRDNIGENETGEDEVGGDNIGEAGGGKVSENEAGEDKADDKEANCYQQFDKSKKIGLTQVPSEGLQFIFDSHNNSASFLKFKSQRQTSLRWENISFK